MWATFATFQVAMFWLKLLSLNIAYMLVTDAVFHFDMSWLKDEADWNICCMFVTFSVFQFPI